MLPSPSGGWGLCLTVKTDCRLFLVKNLGTLKTAGSKIFSSPVLAEKTLGVIGLGKKQ